MAKLLLTDITCLLSALSLMLYIQMLITIESVAFSVEVLGTFVVALSIKVYSLLIIHSVGDKDIFFESECFIAIVESLVFSVEKTDPVADSVFASVMAVRSVPTVVIVSVVFLLRLWVHFFQLHLSVQISALSRL